MQGLAKPSVGQLLSKHQVLETRNGAGEARVIVRRNLIMSDKKNQ